MVMKVRKCLLLLTVAACAATAWAAPAKREPHIGYLYPGGGQQGAVFEVTVGGQFFRGVTDVYVSGQGVRASVVKHYRLRRNIPQEQRQALQKKLGELVEKRVAELPEEDRSSELLSLLRARKQAGKRRAAQMNRPAQGKTAESKPARAKSAESKPARAGAGELPDHPLLRDLESKDLRGLQHVANTLLNFKDRKKKQPNSQLAEMVLIEVTVDRNAPPGDRELRLGTPFGLTNPMCFQVSTLPEVREQEPNDPDRVDYLPKETPVGLPVVLNGQILPGDIDRFRFRAEAGQGLVFETYARHLVPFLADAVPGWFQATLALYDAQGNELAFADDYRFRPDPVLFYLVPADGEYVLEIRDSIYRGREDFVYRVAVGELPFVTQAFPLGGRSGARTVADVDGWNLPRKRLPLDTRPGDHGVRHTAVRQKRHRSNEVTFAVDTLPECEESEPNDDVENAQRIALPRTVNGRIARPGDVDVFRIEGRAGDEVVAEVVARRLHSPVDSLLRLTDASGEVLAWNDDHVRKEGHLHTDMGVLTHHADSYLSVRLPENGTYYVYVADAQNHGSDACAYRLRISPPRPDFALRMTPSSLSMRAGRLAPFAVHVLRKDGFDGEIEVAFRDAPSGFALSGARIPAGRDSVRMTLAAPREGSDELVALHLEGRARIHGKTVTRPVVPSDDVMQAFLYRHLAPAQELLVAVAKGRRAPARVTLAGDGPVRVPAGGAARVLFKTARRPKAGRIELELSDAAEGVTLQDVRVVSDGLAFDLKVEGDAAQVGFADNLIVEAFTEIEVKKRDNKRGRSNDKEKAKNAGKAETQKRRVSLGVLPAVPFVVVQP